MGALPILDIAVPPLPDERKDLAADMELAGFLVGHDALGGGDDGDAQTAQDAGELVSPGIDAQAGLRHAAQAGDGLFLAGEVFQGDADDALGAVVDELIALDVAFVQKDLGDGLLHFGRGHVHGLMLGRTGVADAGQHICDGVGDLHLGFPPSFRVTAVRGHAPEVPGQFSGED